MYKDLRENLAELERIGQLKLVQGAHWDTEIGALANITAGKFGPALLFDNIPGYPKGYRVVTNNFNNPKTMAVALGLEPKETTRELVQEMRTRYKEWISHPIAPRFVSSGPVMENVHRGEEVDLYELPTPVWHHNDVSPVTGERVRMLGTMTAVITQDPETGWVNLGTYRNQVFSRNRVGLDMRDGRHGAMHRDKWWKQGKPMPVAISVGHDPLVGIFAGMEVAPHGVSDYDVMGAIRGEPVEVIKGPLTGLPIPATAEIVLEGFYRPDDERFEEGPFGEWAGYTDGGSTKRSLLVEAVYHRNDPIISGCPPGKPPRCNEMYLLCTWRAALVHNALEAAGVPGVTAVWGHETGNSRVLLIVAIKQQYIGHARQAGLIASQCAAGAYTNKYVVVVDDDIDIYDTNDWLWAVCFRSMPDDSIEIIRRTYGSGAAIKGRFGGWSPSLHKVHAASETQRTLNVPGSVCLIDATVPFEYLNEKPETADPPAELRAALARKWPDLVE
ncbi:MAG: UbiD family decarboxylase [Chloroflexi bacterium]|nr:UbiD family decarboxylase [Chloroflexota bacterium]